MNPKQSLERAAYNYLNNLETPLDEDISIYKGVENPISVNNDENTEEPQQREHPSVTLEAEGSHDEAVMFTKTFQGALAITVEAIASQTTDTEFNAMCDEVFSKFDISELEANFSSRTAGFFMYQMHSPVFTDAVNNGQNWQKTLRFNCIYAEADL